MEPNLLMDSTDDVVLQGIPAIAEHLGTTKRRTSWLHQSRQIPTFRLGKITCLRVGTWRRHVDELEGQAKVTNAALLREDATE